MMMRPIIYFRQDKEKIYQESAQKMLPIPQKNNGWKDKNSKSAGTLGGIRSPSWSNSQT